jgi:murein DD-endopeptidase MepM/ murein hydrolase activator NlpD
VQGGTVSSVHTVSGTCHPSEECGRIDPCGTGLVIDAGNGISWSYCHAEAGSVRFRPGDVVSAGDVVFTSGNTGRSTGPHLHLGVRVNGQSVCPQPLLMDLYSGRTSPIAPLELPDKGCTYKVR